MPSRPLLPALLLSVIALAGCGSGDKQAVSSDSTVATTGSATSASATKPAAEKPQTGPTGAQRDAAIARIAATGLPVYCGAPVGNLVALTFDDGPNAYTHFVLKRLRRNKMKATFFLVGSRLPEYGEFVQRELAHGTVGNHSMTHAYLPGLDAAAMKHEIDETTRLIEQRSKRPVVLFRPPYGANTPAINAHVKSRGMAQILWNVDSRDALGANYAEIFKTVRNGLRPGAIILMHDGRGQTVRTLPPILHALRNRGLKAVTIGELLATHPPTMAQLKKGPKGCRGTR